MRIVRRAIGVAVVAVLALTGLLVWVTARALPQASGTGNPFDRHHDDRMGPWLDGETVPLPFTPAAVAAAASATLTLTP